MRVPLMPPQPPQNLRIAPYAQKTLLSRWIESVNPRLPRGEASVRCKSFRCRRKGLAGLSPTSLRPSCCSHSRIVTQSPLHCRSPSGPLCVLFPLLDCPFPLSAPHALQLLSSSRVSSSGQPSGLCPPHAPPPNTLPALFLCVGAVCLSA